ncbi:hypothetical protein VTJ04DRAFT_950 [Mycothermus thermophilus]|uniref:uncharacterized protein n=1 Tax=Humicola insolens TaxID=85995 RepID=UPI003743E333
MVLRGLPSIAIWVTDEQDMTRVPSLCHTDTIIRHATSANTLAAVEQILSVTRVWPGSSVTDSLTIVISCPSSQFPGLPSVPKGPVPVSSPFCLLACFRDSLNNHSRVLDLTTAVTHTSIRPYLREQLLTRLESYFRKSEVPRVFRFLSLRQPRASENRLRPVKVRLCLHLPAKLFEFLSYPFNRHQTETGKNVEGGAVRK